jgi:hypothetical protein
LEAVGIVAHLPQVAHEAVESADVVAIGHQGAPGARLQSRGILRASGALTRAGPERWSPLLPAGHYKRPRPPERPP